VVDSFGADRTSDYLSADDNGVIMEFFTYDAKVWRGRQNTEGGFKLLEGSSH
jgi:hypothetical protein